MKNPWDDLSQHFSHSVSNEDVPGDVADNVLIAWPVVLNFLEQSRRQSLAQRRRVLDFGCGTGAFTAKLASLGYQAVGVDPSAQMIQLGRTAHNEVEFHQGDGHSLVEHGSFDAVVAMMSLQFVPNIQETLTQIEKVLALGGILILAVFNPQYVRDCLEQGVAFADFDSELHPQVGTLEFGNAIKVTTYIRTADDYRQLLQNLGFECLLETYPPFDREFIERFPGSGPFTSPEFMILGFRKSVE